MNKFKLRFVPLGGVVGVTKNMYLYELYENDLLKDILIVDCGIGFPNERELGVDLVIPDISYLIDKINKIKAIVLTHGHEDHISGLPYHYEKLGRPLVLASKLTAAFVANKFKEFGQTVRLEKIDYQKELVLGDFQIRFIHLTHSIPDTVHLMIKTPAGNIYHGTDFKFDLTPPYGQPPDFYNIVKAGKDGVLCLVSDCLGAEREGLTLSEAVVSQTFEDEMRKTKGKFIMTTFSSNISRIRQCVEAAVKFNRKILFLGRSMEENTRLAQEIGYLPIPYNLVLKEKEIAKMPPNKICLIVAGSQGQYDSALSKLSQKQNPLIKIKPGDKVVFSSDPIPGNEASVYSLIEELTLEGAEVIYPDITEQLHASGHGNKEDLKFLARFTNPKYFIPIGGDVRHQKRYQMIIQELGWPKENVFCLTEGQTIWFEERKARLGDAIATSNIYVDAYGVGDVGNIVLRDRQTLSAEGIVIAFIVLDQYNHLLTQPKIVSRGFIFEKEDKELINNAIKMIEQTLKPKKEKIINLISLKAQLIKNLEQFFYHQKGRRPLVIAEIIQL
ncbi:MAG: ribonuclease J [Microgenomates group bacterium]|nr:ribonuclease J [Microgenomates group bacterium]